MEMKFKQIELKHMNIDQITFKYYLASEMDRFLEDKERNDDGEMLISKRDMDRLYFDILDRYEPYFEERPRVQPLNKIINKLQP